MTELQRTSSIAATIEDRVEHINMLTKAVKQSFFEIALQMRAIKDEGGFKNNKVYLAYMEERTGYKSAAIYNLLRAHEAIGNLDDFTRRVKKLPDAEWQIRPLATKKLNEDPELQAEIWTEVVEAAGDGEITAKMVKDAVKVKVNPDPPTPPPAAPITQMFTDMEAEIGAEILKIAYRNLSKKYHPDAGGSEEQMQALNKMKSYIGKLLIDPLKEEI